MTAGPSYEWDIFISYAREDADWVDRNLYEPLKGCRTEEGHAPKVFLDKDAIRPGANWPSVLAGAIEKSRRIIPVYSASFFASEMCRFELDQAVMRDPMGYRETTVPVLIDANAANAIPGEAKQLQFLDTAAQGWFDRLAKHLGLKHVGRVHTLRFTAKIPEVTINQTLPPLQVAMEYNGVPVEDEDESISLLAEEGTLRGTLSARTHRGVAVFSDLFFETVAPSSRLVAIAASCPAAYSEPFAVQPAARIETRKETPLIPARGDALFLPAGDAVAVLAPGAVEIYDLDATLRTRAQLPPRTRLVSKRPSGLIVVSWLGGAEWIGVDGSRLSWSLGDGEGFNVPGDIAVDGSDGPVYAGMWNGKVFRLGMDGSAELVLEHKPGVQALAVSGEEFFICGFDGFLSVYAGGMLEGRHQTDRIVRLLKLYPDAAVIAGERKLYQFSRSRRKLLDIPVQITIAAVCADPARPIAIAPDGRGIVFDHNLAIHGVFHAAAGAAPVSADAAGAHCALRNPDGSYSLLQANRVTFHHTDGVLAVSRDGDRFAVGEAGGIRILPRELFDELVLGKRNA
jgi:hypothetical protein